jgi:hypothetical protein
MKISKQQLNEYIRLYLNDVDDYSDDNHYFMLAEQTLNKFGKLLIESKQDIMSTLQESISKADVNTKEVFEDFMIYIKNI